MRLHEIESHSAGLNLLFRMNRCERPLGNSKLTDRLGRFMSNTEMYDYHNVLNELLDVHNNAERMWPNLSPRRYLPNSFHTIHIGAHCAR